jgi:osmotically-inducible protein OsmY
MAQDSEPRNAAEPTAKQQCADAETIGKDITQALHRSKSFPQTIYVDVEGNEVKLTGIVRTLQDKKTAEATARKERGATRVTNDINIP